MSAAQADNEKPEAKFAEYGEMDRESDEKRDIVHEENLPKSSTVDGYVPETAPRYTPEEEARVIRKLDWNMIPLLFLLYTLSVLDRTNLGNARIAGMSTDLHLGSTRYNWLGTIFYISCTHLTCRPSQCRFTDLI
jgi:hypothetical protein